MTDDREPLGDLSQYPKGVRQVASLPWKIQHHFYREPWGKPNLYTTLWCGHPHASAKKDHNGVEYCTECSK
jgi:hypothetical protein